MDTDIDTGIDTGIHPADVRDEQDAAVSVASTALACGADDAEAYLESGLTHRVTVLGDRLTDSAGDRTDLALRCWSGGRYGLVTGTGAAWPELVGDAVARIRGAGVPGTALLAQPWPRQPPVGEVPVVELDAAEDVVHTLRRRLRLPAAYLLGIGYTGRYVRRSVANSLGLSLAHWRTSHEVWCWLEGAGGHVRLGASGAALADLAPERLAAELLEQAGCLTAASAVPEGVMPVLFGPLAAADLAGAFARLLCGQHLLGDLGVLRERMGRRIASPQVTLTDEATSPFDDEGTPVGPVTLIERGRLRGVLHSLETAHGLGMAPNGRARRAELSAPPAPAPAMACLAPGSVTPEELAAELGTGPLLTGLLKAGRVRSGTGRFTAVGYGWWLHRGVPVRRISGVAVSAGVFELLRSIVACGNDLRFAPLAGGAGAPSVLVSGMQVG